MHVEGVKALQVSEGMFACRWLGNSPTEALGEIERRLFIERKEMVVCMEKREEEKQEKWNISRAGYEAVWELRNHPCMKYWYWQAHIRPCGRQAWKQWGMHSQIAAAAAASAYNTEMQSLAVLKDGN